MRSAFPIALIGLAVLFTGCDLLDQVAGRDPVKSITRDNPFDPQSSKPLVFGLDSSATTVGTVRPSIKFRFSGSLKSYSLQISETDDFSGTLVYEETGITEPTHRLTQSLANHAHYFWRVRPQFEDGTEAAWSDLMELEVELPLPTLSVPSDGAEVVTPFPGLAWALPAGFSESELLVGTDSAFSENVVSHSGTDKTLVLSSGLEHGTTVYWKGRILDYGVAGDWSPVQTFSVELPVIQIVGPGNGVSTHEPKFQWYRYLGQDQTISPEGLTGYTFEISATASFSVGTTNTATIPTDGSTYMVDYSWSGALSPLSTRYWRVRGIYGSSFPGPWSAGRTIYLDRVERSILVKSTQGTIYGTSWIAVAADGTVRGLGRDGVLRSLAADGTELWRTTTSNENAHLMTPDGRVFLTRDSSSYAVRCISPTGTISWTYALDGRPIGDLAAAADGTVYLLVRRTYGTVVLKALSPEGSPLWEYETTYAPATSLNPAPAVSPRVNDDGRIGFGAGATLYLINSGGTLNWKTSVGEFAYDSALTVSPGGQWTVNQAGGYKLVSLDTHGAILWTKNAYFASPAAGSDGTIFVRGADTSVPGFYAFKPDGTTKWNVSASPFYVTIGTEGVIYGWDRTNNKLLAINSSDGSTKWTQSLDYSTYSIQWASASRLFTADQYQIVSVTTQPPQ